MGVSRVWSWIFSPERRHSSRILILLYVVNRYFK
jgi:hypothetical protein